MNEPTETITLEIPCYMMDYLRSDFLGKRIAGHFGGQEMPDVRDRIIHLIELSGALPTKADMRDGEEIPF